MLVRWWIVQARPRTIKPRVRFQASFEGSAVSAVKWKVEEKVEPDDCLELRSGVGPFSQRESAV
jgi:hypothetical protein